MNRRFETLLAVLCGTAILGAGFGCEDDEARRRAEVQQQITEARAQFQRASLGSTDAGDDHAQQAKSDLGRIVNTLQGVTDGEPGQQAAKSLLMAEALRELSIISYRSIHELESVLQVQRASIRNRLLGTQRLAAIGQSREAVTAEQHRQELMQIRQATDQQLQQVQQELSRITEPIEELTDRNERDRERVDALREQATELIRRADELGPADGFETFEEAIRLQREADLIEFRTAHRELELLLEHQPVKEMNERQARAAEDLKQQLQTAINDLEQFDALYASAAANLRDRIHADRELLRDRVGRISDRMTNELSEGYLEAAEHLERAVSQARQASTRLRGEEANTARLIQARASEARGRLYWRQAGGIADHLALLGAIAGSPQAIGDTQPFEAKIEQFADQHETLIGQAKAAYAEAKESLDMITGAAGQQVASYRQNLEMLRSAMEGDAVDVWQRDTRQPSGSSGDSAPQPSALTTDATGGFESAEALVRFLRRMDETSTDDIERMISATHAESPIGRAYTGMMNSMTRGMAELFSAVEQQFGAAAMSQLSALGGGTGFEDIEIVEQSETRASARHTPIPGMPEGTVELINLDGRWFIDGDSLGGEEMGGQEMGLAMLEQMEQAITQQMSALTRRVKDGEFASIEEFMREMMQAMQGGPG